MRSIVESIYNISEAKTEYNPQDFHRFMKNYKKFKEGIEEDDIKSDKLDHAIEEIEKWINDCEKQKGLPMSYGRYDQFAKALITFDPSARDGFGGLYPTEVTKKLKELWKKYTGETIELGKEP